MTSKFRVLAAAILALSLQLSYAVAQDERATGGSVEKAARSGVITPDVIVAVAGQAALSFKAAAVGIASASAQKLTASFTVSGYSGTFTPTAALHYGHDYTIDTIKCTVSGSSETCKVTISFIPTLPGARKDALLLNDGATTLATVLLGGIGQSPLALIQPGIVTSPVANADYYIYQSVV